MKLRARVINVDDSESVTFVRVKYSTVRLCQKQQLQYLARFSFLRRNAILQIYTAWFHFKKFFSQPIF